MSYYLNYIRNCLIVIFVQSIIVQFCLNNSIVPRLGITPFKYYEIVLMISSIWALFHNYRSIIIIQQLASINTILSAFVDAYGKVSLTSIKKLMDIENSIKKDKD